MRPAARHACASRSPSYRCTSLPALLVCPAAASRLIPPASVSAHPAASCACTPHQPPCRFIPPASAPVRPADRRAGVFRRRQAGLYCRKAALPIPFRSKGYPFHICSAARITVPYSVLRQGTPLGIASRRKGRRLRLLHCGKNRCGLFCLTRTPQPNRPRPPRRQTRLNPALSPVPPGCKKTAARRMTRRRTFFFCAVRSYMNTTPYTALVNASSAFFLSSKICERSL